MCTFIKADRRTLYTTLNKTLPTAKWHPNIRSVVTTIHKTNGRSINTTYYEALETANYDAINTTN